MIDKNFLTFKIFKEFPEIDCRFYGKNEPEPEIIDDAVCMEQLHGSSVIYLGEDFRGSVVKESDALLTNRKKIYISVKVADCVPIFICAPDIKTIGIIHSGWKGTLKNIAGKTVRIFQEKGANLKKIKVAIGASICEKCYEVDEKRVLKFKDKFKELNFGKNHLNLKNIVRHELIESGVVPPNIEVSKFCTKCDNDKFYSFRAGDGDKRNVGVIGILQ